MKSSTMKAELAADNRLIKPKKPISNRVLCANFIEVITINVIQSLVALLKVFLAFFHRSRSLFVMIAMKFRLVFVDSGEEKDRHRPGPA